MLNSESSLRLNLLRFPLIFGVVFIHASATKVGFSGGQVGLSQPVFIVDFIRNFISSIASVSVPTFFLMSGYLFFTKFKLSKQSYLVKLKTRAKTLLVPFLFWNLIAFIITAIAQSLPATRGFFSGNHASIASYTSIFDYFNTLIGFTGPPIAYQFWFIRDLMVLVLLVPLISILINFAPIPFIGVVLTCWLTGFWPIYIPSSMAVLFFSIGAYLASRKQDIFCLDKFGLYIIALYLSVVTIDVITRNQSPIPYLYNIGLILGTLGALFSTRFIARNPPFKSLILKLNAASFFVYAIHEPLLTILKKVLYKAFSPDSPVAILALYFSLPLIIIGFAIALYHIISRISPRFTGIITGGR